MPDRRVVRAAPEFFADLDALLPAERSADGTPSRLDFQTYELLNIVERFAVGFDDLPLAEPDAAKFRLLVTHGLFVPTIAVTGLLRDDGSVELLRLNIQLYDADDDGIDRT